MLRIEIKQMVQRITYFRPRTNDIEGHVILLEKIYQISKRIDYVELGNFVVILYEN